MSKFIKPASLLLYVLTVMVFFMIGGTLVKFTGAAEGRGLAGGAIVFFYGVIAAFIALIASFFLVYFAANKSIVRTNWVLLFVFAVFAVTIRLKIINTSRNTKPETEYQQKTTSPGEMLSVSYIAILNGAVLKSQMSKTYILNSGKMKY